MVDRLKAPHMEMNHFKYTRILKRHRKRIDLLITYKGKEKEVGLPLDFIEIFPVNNDVYIPEFLCERQIYCEH